MKATQSQIREAVDSFFYTYDWLTGGTAEEIERQAPQGIISLQESAAKVAALVANPNKVAANNEHLMEMARVRIPAKLELYRRYIPGTLEHAERAAARAEQQRKNEIQLQVWNALEALTAEPAPENVIFYDFRVA